MPIEIEREQVRYLSARLSEPRRFMQVVAGPRQVGKTTLVRQALAKLGEKSRNTVSAPTIPAWLAQLG